MAGWVVSVPLNSLSYYRKRFQSYCTCWPVISAQAKTLASAKEDKGTAKMADGSLEAKGEAVESTFPVTCSTILGRRQRPREQYMEGLLGQRAGISWPIRR